MSGQMRLLLDKNIVRRYFEGVSALARGLTLVEEEQRAILLVHLARRKKRQLFISVEVFNLLQVHGRRVSPAETLMFFKRVEVLYPGRYFKRWAAIPVTQVITLLLVHQGQRFERLLVLWARFHREQRSDRIISGSNVEKQGQEDTASTDTFHKLAWRYRGSCAIAPQARFS